MGTMICGYDDDEQKIYLVEENGKTFQGNLFSVGSPDVSYIFTFSTKKFVICFKKL